MKLNSNFERARALADKWPEWKRSYELTKDSVRGSAFPPETITTGESNHGQGAERKAASSHKTK